MAITLVAALVVILLSSQGNTVSAVPSPPTLGVSVGGQVPNSAFSASSQFERLSYASKARLKLRGHLAAWVPVATDTSPWLQVDLGTLSDVLAITTQGRQDAPPIGRAQYTKSYIVSYSTDGVKYDFISENGVNKTFRGNKNRNSLVTNDLIPAIQAQYVRIHPIECPPDLPCALRLDVLGYHVCKDNFTRFGPHCYKYVTSVGNYSQQQMNCMDMGGNLVSIASEEENDFISNISKNVRSWIGGKLDPNTDQHIWNDGSDWSFTSWRKREPNRWANREYCVETNFVKPGWWNDHFCKRMKPAICKKETI